MAKTEMIRARMEPRLKREVEKIFSALGLSPTEAITLFYKQVTFYHGLPFTVRIPGKRPWKLFAKCVREKILSSLAMLMNS